MKIKIFFTLIFFVSNSFAQNERIEASTWRTCYVKNSPDGDWSNIALTESKNELYQMPNNLDGKLIGYKKIAEDKIKTTYQSGSVLVEYSKDMNNILFSFTDTQIKYTGTCNKPTKK